MEVSAVVKPKTTTQQKQSSDLLENELYWIIEK